VAVIFYNVKINNAMPVGRPSSIRTRHFLRKLSDTEAAILAHAGQGDISAGFKNLLDMYCQIVNNNLSDSLVSSEKQSVTDEG
jgi:hypothetical protein